MNIKYIARNAKGDKVEGASIKECLSNALSTDWKKFTIMEYRNGEHRQIIGGIGSYLIISHTRATAQTWIDCYNAGFNN